MYQLKWSIQYALMVLFTIFSYSNLKAHQYFPLSVGNEWVYENKKTGQKRLSKKGKPYRYNNLPKSTLPVCHVRPHATDGEDTFPLPVEDRILKVKEYTKQGFWFSRKYILNKIYLK